MTTLFHAKYWAHDLLLQRAPDRVEALASLGNARVDLNPHQVEAALFALRSPYSAGALLADEVGLGKTIEAALVLAQRWAERRRKILLIVPATLRKQWQTELADKFFLPSVTQQPLPKESHLRFRYEPKVSALGRYVGESGWLLVAKHARTAVGRTEESLLVAACADDGTPLEEEVAEKLFSLKGEAAGTAGAPPDGLARVREALIATRGAALDVKNHAYLAEESEKLDNWAEDRKQTLERDLKGLKKDIDATKKQKRATTLLAERLEVEKKVKALEHKLADKRKQNEAADKEIDQRREQLIEQMQAQLASQSATEDLFTIRWTLEAAA